jgi:large subunit ribosomal protein L31e
MVDNKYEKTKTEKKTKSERLERIYTIPLRSEWLKAPKYKRAKKTIRAIKEFLVKHMKIYDRDLNKIKVDPWINRAIWSRGIKNVPHKIIVKAIKEDGEVKTELVSLPRNFKSEDEFFKKKIEKEKKREAESKKKADEKKKALEKLAEEKKKAEVKKEEEKSIEEKLGDEKKKEEEKELHSEKEVKHEHQHAGHEVKNQVKTSVHKTNTKK